MSLQHPGPADEAQMRQEFRRLYREIGFDGCMQVLFEILKSGEWLSEVMIEEKGGTLTINPRLELESYEDVMFRERKDDKSNG